MRQNKSIRPVEQIELNEDRPRRRLILVVLLLTVAAAALALSLYRLLSAESGYITVEVSTRELNCGGDFTLRYELGRGSLSPTAERKALSTLYTQAAVDAYRLFHAHDTFEGVVNPAYLSRHPNETVTVDAALYRAFEELERAGSRLLYLAPVYETYSTLFHCAELWETAQCDPWQDAELAAWCREASALANDPAAIQLELLGENQVRLRLSEGYLAFAKENDVRDYLDFFWAQNAFIADFLAERLAESGYTHGYLYSFDGFTRNLYAEGGSFTVPVYDRAGNTVYPAAAMTYTAPLSLVSLHSYPLDPSRSDWYFAMPEGVFRCAYIDTADGLCKTALPDLLGYSRETGCAGVLLALERLYIRETPDLAALSALAADGIYAVWCEDFTLRCTDSAAVFAQLYQDGETVYAAP